MDRDNGMNDLNHLGIHYCDNRCTFDNQTPTYEYRTSRLGRGAEAPRQSSRESSCAALMQIQHHEGTARSRPLISLAFFFPAGQSCAQMGQLRFLRPLQFPLSTMFVSPPIPPPRSASPPARARVRNGPLATLAEFASAWKSFMRKR